MSRLLSSREQTSLPWFMKLILHVPLMRRLPARLIGIGIRPEHVRP